MKVRRAMKMLGILSAALMLFGCGVVEDYETAAVLQITSNQGAVITVSDTSVSGDELQIIVHNYPRPGAGDPIDLMVTDIEFQYFVDGVERRASAPGNQLVKANSDTTLTISGIADPVVVAFVQAFKLPYSYRLNMVITAREVNKSGELGNAMTISDSAAVSYTYASSSSARNAGGSND